MRQHRALQLGAKEGRTDGWWADPDARLRPITDFDLLELPDGRRLEYCVSGPDDGPALVYHHGTPGACVQYTSLAASAHRLGLRLVTSSRPGYGQSTRHPGRRIVDVTGDTEHLLDELSINRFLVAGWSGGGPYALACGARMGGRVRAVLVIAGIAPPDAPGLDFLAGMRDSESFDLARRGEDALRPRLEAEREALQTASDDEADEALASFLPEADLRALAEGMGEDAATQILHGVSEGVDGWLDDDLAFVADWGFALDEISVPAALWQGGDDRMVPVSHGRWLAAHVPGAVAHFEDGEGHLSIGAHPDRLLQELVALGS